MSSNYQFANLAYAYGKPKASGILKSKPEDFLVEEQIAYELSGEGEHLWLWIEKVGENTDWVAKELASWAGISIRNVGYAGKKDRQAITRQWFSLHLPGKDNPDMANLNLPNVQVLKQVRHQKKLHKGGLSGNRFELVLRGLQGDLQDLTQRCEVVSKQGVPNYFGEQRFGKQMHNLDMAEKLFNKQLKRPKAFQKGLYLSAARSWIFNQILDQRIQLCVWNQGLPGDAFMLEGSSKCFADDGKENLYERILSGDIHPTGLLTGKGEYMTQGQPKAIEEMMVADFESWQAGLCQAGMKQERRALRVMPQAFEYQLEEDKLKLSFSLPSGAYATMVVREILNS